MDIFEIKLRGFHAKAVQNIMARTSGFYKSESKQKIIKPKGDNITTYLRKFEIDRENLNLAKRILLCESQHNHKYYIREWKKTQNFLRVRSNFKRSLCNEQPRIFKFEPILGIGSCLLTLTFTKFQSSSIYFRPDAEYSLKILVKNNSVTPTNAIFTLNTLGNNQMSFYIPNSLKKKKITCKIIQIKQNQIYDKGKLVLNLAQNQEQEVEVTNKQGRAIALVKVKIQKQSKKKKDNRGNSNKSAHLGQKQNYLSEDQ